jgi:hypothetical protein
MPALGAHLITLPLLQCPFPHLQSGMAQACLFISVVCDFKEAEEEVIV